MANHFVNNIAHDLKGQLACDSKASAIKYKQYLDELGWFESAVVMSPPDTREGNTAVDETAVPEITRWWKDHVGSQDEQAYTKQVVARFADEQDPLRLLIVVDKLLTGFDEPKNAVLYIDKPLKQHNLIQAIARVNRLHTNKPFGLLIDYRGILAELDTTLRQYQDLASRTQGGYDIHDIAGLYNHVSSEYKRLPQRYDALWAIFAGVKNKNDIEQLRQRLVPRLVEENGAWIDSNQKLRDDFYEALTAFSRCLTIALQSMAFFEDKSFSEAKRIHYKETAKQFASLRLLVQQDAGERINYQQYQQPLKKLLDRQVAGIMVREPDGVYELSQMGQPYNDWSDEKIRNETDLIKTRVTRMIEQELRDDPYAQAAFSTLLRQAIADTEKLFDHPLKQYLLFCKFEKQVQARRLADIPDALAGKPRAQAYFGLCKQLLPDAFVNVNQEAQDKWIALALEIEQMVVTSRAENSINPQNLEANLRNKLLPRLWQECKAIGCDTTQAKEIVERIVQITRDHLSRV